MNTLDSNREAIGKALPWAALVGGFVMFVVLCYLAGRPEKLVMNFRLPAVTTESNTIVRVVLQFNSDGSVTWERQ